MIKGIKTAIKGLTKESAKDIYKWVNKEDLRPLTGTVYPVSEYEHEEWIRKQVLGNDKKLFLITDINSGRNIGTIGLKNIDWINRNAELYISIGEDLVKLGKGFGTDAVKTMLNYCFNTINLHRIYLHVFESNKRAIKCYEKSGMKIEGVLLEHHFQSGKYENVFIMGITKTN